MVNVEYTQSQLIIANIITTVVVVLFVFMSYTYIVKNTTNRTNQNQVHTINIITQTSDSKNIRVKVNVRERVTSDSHDLIQREVDEYISTLSSDQIYTINGGYTVNGYNLQTNLQSLGIPVSWVSVYKDTLVTVCGKGECNRVSHDYQLRDGERLVSW